ncbi:MAG: elongation factor P [Verrucomicrobia bacterium]|nr:elongation factor P [Verrucomicrobiota bacterium]
MATANDVRKGMAIKYGGEVCVVLETQHRTPGNLRAFVQATIRNIKTGKSSAVRFASTEQIEVVSLTRRKLEFSYKDNSGYTFMDPGSYESVTLHPELVGNGKDYLVEGSVCEVLFNEEVPVQIDPPPSVDLKVLESPEGVRGDTASNVQKPALLETGITVNVPLFIKEGEVIKIDTRTGQYMGRA